MYYITFGGIENKMYLQKKNIIIYCTSNKRENVKYCNQLEIFNKI